MILFKMIKYLPKILLTGGSGLPCLKYAWFLTKNAQFCSNIIFQIYDCDRLCDCSYFVMITMLHHFSARDRLDPGST